MELSTTNGSATTAAVHGSTHDPLLLSEIELLESLAAEEAAWRLNVLSVPAVRAAIVALYVVIIVVGTLTNSAVVLVGFKSRRSPKQQTHVTTIFVVVLAASDFCLCIFSLPVQLHYQMTEQWNLGETMCRLVFSAFALPMYVSAFTILFIAVDRYRLIVRPLENRLSARLAALLIAFNVAFSMLMSSPVVYYSAVEKVDLPDVRFFKTLCVEKWPNERARRVYSVLTFCFQFCLPLTLTTVLYSRIYARLKNRNRLKAKNRKGSGDGSGGKRTSAVGAKSLKTFKILLAIVFNFAACWTPWNVFSLVSELERDVVAGSFFVLVDVLLKAFAMLSACTNPVLYCWLNDQLRQDIQVVAVRLRLSSSKNDSVSQSKQDSRRKVHNPPRLTVEPPSCSAIKNPAVEPRSLRDRLSSGERSTCLTGKLISSSSN